LDYKYSFFTKSVRLPYPFFIKTYSQHPPKMEAVPIIFYVYFLKKRKPLFPNN